MLSQNEFINRVKKLTRIESKTGKASYSKIQIVENTVQLKRDSTGNFTKLKINELYTIYTNLDYINTINIRPYIQGRKYSPACAILMAIKVYNRDGIRI